MKIAFIVGTFPTLSVSFILNQIKGLIDHGHEVDIYALDGRPEDVSKVHPIVEEYKLLERTYYPPKRRDNNGFRWLKLWILLLVNLSKNSFVLWQLLDRKRFGKEAKYQRLIYKAIPFLRRKPYDIIHCQFGIFGLMALAFRDIGIIQGKILTTFRGYDISKYLQKRGERVYDQLFEQGDFFLTNCDYFRQRAIQLGCDEQKIRVLGSGIDCRKFAFTPRYFPADGCVRIVSIGRLSEKKGIEYGIRAIAKLAPVHSKIEYNIIGDGSLKEYFQNLIAELGVGHIVNLLGWKQQEELVEILDQSHILIAPSVTAADGNQDAPVNTLKEAMAMGLPVIGTLHGGIPELIENGISGFLVPERDADAIAEKVNYLIEHPEIWQSMGQAGRARVEETYDMYKLNQELLEIYQQLLNSELPQCQFTNQPVEADSSVSKIQPDLKVDSLAMTDPQVTLVVVPRERFSYTQESLESIYEHTDIPFKLVYVDGNSPTPVKRYLESQAQAKSFQLVRTNYYLSPNHARNIGLSYVDTKYLVFMDNDVIVSPGWLKALVTCAEETGATVVSPLMCQDEPVHEMIHFAGGECHVVTDIHGKRHIREKMYKQGQSVVEVRPQLKRFETELAEFHCVLVRREIFQKIGCLDSRMLCTKEHLDFCLTVREAGGTVYFEPDSLVTYVPGALITFTDIYFYMLRWSDAWMYSSLEILRQKWGLVEDGYFKTKYNKKLGSRRRRTIIKPLSYRFKKLGKKVGLQRKQIEKALLAVDKVLNRYISDRYARKYLQPQQQLSFNQDFYSCRTEFRD